MHTQEKYKETGTKPTSRNPQLPKSVFKDGVVTAVVPVVEVLPGKTDTKQESERYSAFV